MKVTQILIFVCLLIYSCKKETALEVLPTVETNDVTKIGVWTAESGGRIISEGSSKVTARGVCWSKNYPPTISDSKSYDVDNNGSFVSTLEGLVYATTYYVMAFAKNSSGFSYGEIKSFSTLGGKPVTETLPATNMGLNSVKLNSIVTANHYFAEVSFEWGLTTSYGNEAHPVVHYVFALAPAPVSAYIYGLTKGTDYHYRIKAVNQSGTTYGNDVTFKTTETVPASIIFNPDLIYGSVSDIDGNIYKTIKIGIQTWMAENLKTKRFNNGTKITRIEDFDYFFYSTENKPGYAWYNNDSATYYKVYGALYNWYVVDPAIRDVKNVCPVGWHVPGETEWNLLINYLGGKSSAGLRLKETTDAHWKSPAAVATNESGFTALPGGKDLYGDWQFYETTGFWWGSTINNGSYTPYYWSMYYDSGEIIKNTEDRHIGLSVRCVKD
jgi:uncharacterized protein (TIGR02145 family)